MDLIFPVRFLVAFLGLGALIFIGGGVGGIAGTRCAETPVLLREPWRRRLGKIQPESRAVNCSEGDSRAAVLIADTFFTLDQLFFYVPGASGPGNVAWRRFHLSKAKFGSLIRYREAPIDQANIVYARSIGIKAAFFLAVLGLWASIFLALTAQYVVCLDNPRLLEVERLLLVFGLVCHFTAGILALIWGRFAHLNKEQLGELISVRCMGWVAGGAVLIFITVLQLLDLVLSFTVGQPPDPHAEELLTDPTQSARTPPRGEEKRRPENLQKEAAVAAAAEAAESVGLKSMVKSMRWKSMRPGLAEERSRMEQSRARSVAVLTTRRGRRVVEEESEDSLRRKPKPKKRKAGARKTEAVGEPEAASVAVSVAAGTVTGPISVKTVATGNTAEDFKSVAPPV